MVIFLANFLLHQHLDFSIGREILDSTVSQVYAVQVEEGKTTLEQNGLIRY